MSVERYVDKNQAKDMMQTVRDYIDGSGPDGTIAITKNASEKVTQIVLTYAGGVKTTTFSESNGVETIVERDVKTGASTATVVTTVIQSNQASKTTTTVPIT